MISDSFIYINYGDFLFLFVQLVLLYFLILPTNTTVLGRLVCGFESCHSSNT